MAQESLGNMAKRWLRSQTKELLTTDRRERENADVEGDRIEREMKSEATERAVFAAVPGLRDAVERQEARRAAAEADQERERIEELAARPLAGVGLAISGGIDGSWAGQLPASVEVDDDDGTLRVELDAFDHDVPTLAGHPLVGWHFAVPRYAGPGTYDLSAVAAELEEQGDELDYTEFCLGLGGWDEPLYWTAGTGPASVEVGDDGRSLVVRMAMEGAWGGPYEVVAQVNLPG
jgi:hypothetical protein